MLSLTLCQLVLGMLSSLVMPLCGHALVEQPLSLQLTPQMEHLASIWLQACNVSLEVARLSVLSELLGRQSLALVSTMLKRLLFTAMWLMISAASFSQVGGPGTVVVGGGGSGSSGTATALESPVVIEGTPDAFEGNFTFADPTADWTWAWGAAGDLVGAGSLSIDNLKLDGNTLSSTDTNGNIVLDPNGSGVVLLPQATALFLNVTGSDGGTGINSGGTISGIAAGGAISYQLLMTNDAWARLGSGKTINWNSATDMNSGSLDTTIARAAAGIVKITSAINLVPLASPPRTCNAGAEGDIYADTSHALCFCDGTSWNVLTGSGAGTCV